MLGKQEAILKSPPGAAAGAGFNRPFSTSISGVASAVAAVTTLTANDAAGIPPMPFGCFVTWISDTDCYVRVGDANVGVATTADWFLPAGVAVDWWHDGSQSSFSAIQKTAGGTVKRYRSNKT